MLTYHGQCQCGQIRFQIELPKRLNHYQPRACDCDFCVTRNVQYLSDSKGKIFLSKQDMAFAQQQGDYQAQFVTCENCGSIVAATYHQKNEVKGAVNAQLLADRSLLAEPLKVSPKLLSAEEKVNRWRELWMIVVNS